MNHSCRNRRAVDRRNPKQPPGIYKTLKIMGINYRSLNWWSPDFEPSTVETHLFFSPFSSFEGLYLIDANGSNGLPTCSMSSAVRGAFRWALGAPQKNQELSQLQILVILPVSLFWWFICIHLLYPWKYMSLHQHLKKKIRVTLEKQFLSCWVFLQWRLSVWRCKAGGPVWSQSNLPISFPRHPNTSWSLVF